MHGKHVEVDSIWRALRPWGRYQILHVFMMVLDFGPCAFAILSAVFTGYIGEDTFKCRVRPDDNVTVTNETTNYDHYSYDKCSYNKYHTEGNTTTLMLKEQSCSEFQYDQQNTYVTEWNLVCSRTNIAALAQSLVLAGQGIGALTMSHLADRFGRKTIHVISHIGILATMLVMALSPNIYMLLVLRLVAGTFQQGMVCTAKILALEMFPKEIRAHMEVFTFLAWSGGIMLLTVYGVAFQSFDWRYLQVGIAAFSFYALFEWWIIDESVRWLLSNNRVDEAQRILKKAARWNGVEYEKVEAVFAESHALTKQNGIMSEPASPEKHGDPTTKSADPYTNGYTQGTNEYESEPGLKVACQEKVEKYTVIDILKNPSLRVNTLILWYAWVVATGTYYGLTLVSSHHAGDRFVNFFLSGVIEIPGLLLEFYLFNKIGRKKTLILWYALSGLSLIVSTILLTVAPDDNTAQIFATGFSLIGKMASTGAFSTVFLYTPEIYPTNYRNSGLGVASSISRIGGILAPFISNLALIAMWIPGAIFSALCVLVTILALKLPESAKHELPKTISDCNAWERSSSDESTDYEMSSQQSKD